VLNARPAQYLPLQEKYGEQEPPSAQALRRRGRILMGCAFGWVIGWLLFGVAPVANSVSTLVYTHGWAQQEAVNRVLWFDSGGWFNVPVFLILLLVAIVSLMQARRLDKVAG
jgi:xanthine/uracil permease